MQRLRPLLSDAGYKPTRPTAYLWQRTDAEITRTVELVWHSNVTEMDIEFDRQLAGTSEDEPLSALRASSTVADFRIRCLQRGGLMLDYGRSDVLPTIEAATVAVLAYLEGDIEPFEEERSAWFDGVYWTDSSPADWDRTAVLGPDIELDGPGQIVRACAPELFAGGYEPRSDGAQDWISVRGGVRRGVSFRWLEGEVDILAGRLTEDTAAAWNAHNDSFDAGPGLPGDPPAPNDLGPFVDFWRNGDIEGYVIAGDTVNGFRTGSWGHDFSDTDRSVLVVVEAVALMTDLLKDGEADIQIPPQLHPWFDGHEWTTYDPDEL
ncbi:hypothetical protein VV02_11625 [Luteipulveratus mongoliensis]|uniref:Uncharacterized protein n=1 Tax=Luteipulveratus mongoliensis TaxID=571913 RepID=A0A0K1JI12_9MICO|nr:hypothetical protein VV02_11625 [Luteipulveratus mongoliensis]